MAAPVLRLPRIEMQQMFHLPTVRTCDGRGPGNLLQRVPRGSSMAVEFIRRMAIEKLTLCRKAWRAMLLTAAACAALSGGSHAQTTSTIQGTVTDKQGLAVSGAQLKLSGDVIGTSRTTVSDANGAYQFQNLPAGIYTLSVTHAGFATNSLQGSGRHDQSYTYA